MIKCTGSRGRHNFLATKMTCRAKQIVNVIHIAILIGTHATVDEKLTFTKWEPTLRIILLLLQFNTSTSGK